MILPASGSLDGRHFIAVTRFTATLYRLVGLDLDVFPRERVSAAPPSAAPTQNEGAACS